MEHCDSHRVVRRSFSIPKKDECDKKANFGWPQTCFLHGIQEQHHKTKSGLR